MANISGYLFERLI